MTNCPFCAALFALQKEFPAEIAAFCRYLVRNKAKNNNTNIDIWMLLFLLLVFGCLLADMSYFTAVSQEQSREVNPD